MWTQPKVTFGSGYGRSSVCRFESSITWALKHSLTDLCNCRHCETIHPQRLHQEHYSLPPARFSMFPKPYSNSTNSSRLFILKHGNAPVIILITTVYDSYDWLSNNNRTTNNTMYTYFDLQVFLYIPLRSSCILNSDYHHFILLVNHIYLWSYSIKMKIIK